ncbi:MAG: uracil phosphoribosyltransferase [Bacteroidales bacterium]|nr:uracil phosphoribosyltransferase [Bacteroidales bacterium]
MVRNLGDENSIFNQFIFELRHSSIQTDPLRFRRNLERIGEIFAYEISKSFEYKSKEVVTPLGETQIPICTELPVLATILRAGLPLHQGFLNYFDRAPNAFISAYRKHDQNGTFEIELGYSACPDLENKILILTDVMLATGTSIVKAYKELHRYGKPKHTHIVSVLASLEGLNYVRRHLPIEEVTLWTGAVDEELTAQSYIVPGLGDAGDLAYGQKINN